MAGTSQNSCRTRGFALVRRAFTLVELLVVIGIIAVLISVLLPAINRARQHANTVKCETQLREIGHALQLYANENKGWWIVVRHQANNTFPAYPADITLQSPSGVGCNIYWYMYLLKYFSKKDYVDLGGQRLYSYVNTPLWGCPAVDKDNFDVSPTLSSADFNSGYGMGPYAAYTERTFINVNANPAWAMIQSSTGLAGKYYKQSQWTKPAERGIICDGRSWFLETRSPGVGANVPVPPQLGNWAIGYNASAIDQFDRYRHGHRADRVAMNMLYCDGHVETLADVKLAYIAIRRHWPG